MKQAPEFAFLAQLQQQLQGQQRLAVPVGDDASAVPSAPGWLRVTTTDMLLEGTHFSLAWTDLVSLGYKAVAVNVSDVAAMGATPTEIYLALGWPRQRPLEEAQAFMQGVQQACAQYDAVLAGGDTCASPQGVQIAVTAIGEVPAGEIVRRSQAAAGQLLYVSGTLGNSALALSWLQQGRTPPPEAAQSHFWPQARVALGRALAAQGLVGAMLDLSDGLASDLPHMLRASGCAARVDLAALPLSPDMRQATAHQEQHWQWAVCGGEDYELLFSVPAAKQKLVAAVAEQLQLPLTPIGQLEAGTPNILWQTPTGQPWQPPTGFAHF